jgi:hypothetical protein
MAQPDKHTHPPVGGATYASTQYAVVSLAL